MEIILTKKELSEDVNIDNAKVINDAILKVAGNNGGKVIIDEGNFYSTTIELKSNVTLYLNEGARIILFPNLDKFKKVESIQRDDSITRPTWENCDYDGKPKMHFIYAYGQHDIAIDGKGTIDGNEEIFYGTVTKWHIEGAFYPRIPLIYFEDVRNVKIHNVTFTRSAFWTTHLVGCEYVDIDSLTIDNNLRLTNCDGIDPDHSKHVRINNCNIKCADDCVVIKTSEANNKYGPCEDIVVTNCNFISTSAAIKIGTESCQDFKDIHFKNINIDRSNRGISIMLRDNGNVYDCTFEDINMSLRLFSKIHWWGSDEGIAITALPRETTCGNVSNLKFKNININSENGLLIYGNDNISDISFDNVNLVTEKKTDHPKKCLDLRPGVTGILEDEEFHLLTVHGASNIKFNNSTLINKTDYIKQDLNISNCPNLDISGLSIQD